MPLNFNVKNTLFPLLMLFAALPLFAENKINCSVLIDIDSSRYWEEYLNLKGKLGAELDLSSGMFADISVQVDESEVKPDEVSFTFKLGEKIKVRSGYRENFLSMDEFRSSFDRPVATISLIKEYYDYLGYEARYLGMEIYDKNDWYARGGVSYIYPYEPQFNGSYFFHPFGKKSFYGLSGLYLGNYRTILTNHGDNPHHFAFTLHASDLSRPWIYSAETAVGSNYPAPIGYMTLPTDDREKSYFWGVDLLFGRKIPVKEMVWIPALRYSLLMPDAAYGEYFKERAVLGNQLLLNEDARIFVDLFLEHERPYLDLSGDKDIITPAVYAGMQVKTN